MRPLVLDPASAPTFPGDGCKVSQCVPAPLPQALQRQSSSSPSRLQSRLGGGGLLTGGKDPGCGGELRVPGACREVGADVEATGRAGWGVPDPMGPCALTPKGSSQCPLGPNLCFCPPCLSAWPPPPVRAPSAPVQEPAHTWWRGVCQLYSQTPGDGGGQDRDKGGARGWALRPQAWGLDAAARAARAEGLCLWEPLRLLHFQRPPTLPLAGAPAFLLLQMEAS